MFVIGIRVKKCLRKLFYKMFNVRVCSWLLHKICNKAVDNYAHVVEFVADCYKTHEMCNEAVNTYSSTIQFVCE